jgi:hypothetical protein
MAKDTRINARIAPASWVFPPVPPPLGIVTSVREGREKRQVKDENQALGLSTLIPHFSFRVLRESFAPFAYGCPIPLRL